MLCIRGFAERLFGEVRRILDKIKTIAGGFIFRDGQYLFEVYKRLEDRHSIICLKKMVGDSIEKLLELRWSGES